MASHSSASTPMSHPVQAGLRSAIRAIEKLKAINAALIKCQILPRGSREWLEARRQADQEADDLHLLEAEARAAATSIARTQRIRRRGRQIEEITPA